jgi:hypothetical protein
MIPPITHQGKPLGMGFISVGTQGTWLRSAIAANHLRTSCRICYDRKLPKFPQTPDDGARCMSKPRKTTLQLETLVKQEAAKAMPLPKNLVVSVWPDGDSWKVVCHSPNPLKDKECFETIRKEADCIKLKFDLRL